MRTSVNEELDLLSGDESDKPLYVMVGMPDGPQCRSRQHATMLRPAADAKRGITSRSGELQAPNPPYFMCIPEIAREITSC